MTDPVTVALVALAGGLALAAGYLQWPSPPALDGERWFKVMLATLLLGRVDADGGTEDAWIALVKRLVPYHPAGRLPERKVVQPLADPPGKRLSGELALQEKLAGLEGLQARWAWLYDEDPAGIEALTVDPFDLGSAYDPERLVGLDWEVLSRWGADDGAFREALFRRLPVRYALIEGRPDRMAGPALGDALAAELPELLRVAWDDSVDIGAALLRHAPELDQRLVVFAEEAGAMRLMRALQADAGLRDRVIAVVSIGGVLLGRPNEEGPYGEKQARDWMETWFTLDRFDSELVRLTPFFSLQWLDRNSPTPGAAGLPLEAQRFPDPVDDGVMATLEAVDLGPLEPHPDLPLDQVARALIATCGLWTLTRA